MVAPRPLNASLALMKHLGAATAMLVLGTGLGCALTSAPEHDLGFSAVRDLQSLEGCYRNRGEGEGRRYLSAVVWPEEQLAHEQITAIKVMFEEPRSLRVVAVSPEGTAKEGIFTEGKDFHLSSGRIDIKSDAVASFAYPAGNVFIGAGHESRVLGLDARGDARLQESATFAGTAFLVIPMAGNVKDVFRFPRSLELCNES